MSNLGADAEIGTAFSPTAPVMARSLLGGRGKQVQDLVNALFQPGQHAVIFGERGVGKTSLTTAVASALGRTRLFALRVSCDGGDTFSTLWHKVIDELLDQNRGTGAPFLKLAADIADSFRGRASLTPNDVRRFLSALGERQSARGDGQTTAVFIDEFDRLEDRTIRTLFADAIKMMSDHVVPATIVVVGAADRADELITGHHQSLERVLAEIHVPRMSEAELREIVSLGLSELGMTITEDALLLITRVARGLPYYTKLLCQRSALRAVDQGRRHVQVADVRAAIDKALDHAQESVLDTYLRATHGLHGNTYSLVLLACALAKADNLGYFSISGVRDALDALTGERHSILAFARQLRSFVDKRGPVLEKEPLTGLGFRFINPLVQPFIIMRALASETIHPSVLETVTNPEAFSNVRIAACCPLGATPADADLLTKGGSA